MLASPIRKAIRWTQRQSYYISVVYGTCPWSLSLAIGQDPSEALLASLLFFCLGIPIPFVIYVFVIG